MIAPDGPLGAGPAGAAALLALAVALLPGPVEAVRRVAGPGAAARPEVDGARTGGLRLRPALIAPVVGLVTAATWGGVSGLVLGVLVGAAVVVVPGRVARRRAAATDPFDEAGAWDQLAACLRAGLPLDRAVRAVAPSLAPAAASALVRVADLVALGADPDTAWEPALADPSTARLARAARRSARSGAAVADVAETAAADVRAEAGDAVATRAERAGVLVTGPLGLCFLPAFLALGIVPVVIGLAGPLWEQR